MSWKDRIKDAAYIDPAGNRHYFTYEDVSKSFDIQVAEYNFPDAENSTYVQRLGSSKNQHAMTCIFDGDDCDTRADDFEAGCRLAGFGVLEHPLYGTLDVVPGGTFERSDPLKTAANQTIVTLTFYETNLDIYPTSQGDPDTEVLSTVGEFAEASAEQVADNVELGDSGLVEDFRSQITGFTKRCADVFSVLGDIKNDLTTQANQIIAQVDEVVVGTTESLDEAKTQVSNVITGVNDLVNLPGTVFGSIQEKLLNYKNIINATLSPIDVNLTINKFWSQKSNAEACVAGMVSTAVMSEFSTKNEALDAASQIITTFEQVTTYTDAGLDQLGIIDTGEAYQKIQRAVSLIAGYLVETSFTLRQERIIYLDRAYTLIELVAKFYGSIDDADLDFFINSNDLSGSEILEIPAGRKVAYYV